MTAVRALRILSTLLLATAAALLTQCTSDRSQAQRPSPADATSAPPPMSDPEPTPPNPAAPALETATLGAGCYWCIEAVLEQIDGVHGVVSGFMGGHVENPTYEAVCAGITGHAEVVQVTFDPEVLPYEHLLAWFWKLHDPTTLNRQGADHGTQYRSAIYYHSDAQRDAAQKSKAAADASGEFDDPIVTEITEASTFYEAKAEHQDFYRANRNYGYCRAVIAPKLDKLGLKK